MAIFPIYSKTETKQEGEKKNTSNFKVQISEMSLLLSTVLFFRFAGIR